MNRPLTIWASFGFCLALVLGAMGWVSLTVLRLDAESAQSRERAVLEENKRLALWRMDSRLAALIGRENARPYYAYQPFYSAERAYTRMLSKIQVGEVLVPSPLLTEETPLVMIHFQFEPAGDMTSPQVPAGNMLDLAESGYTSHERIQKAARRLSQLKEILDRPVILAVLPHEKPREDLPVVAGLGLSNQKKNKARQQRVEQAVAQVAQEAEQQGEQGFEPQPNMFGLANANDDVQMRGTVQAQKALSSAEWMARNRTAKQVANMENPFNQSLVSSSSLLNVATMQPVWMKEALLLARRVEVGKQDYVQGAWLNWPAIQKQLLDDIRDLLPSATLEPLRQVDEKDTSRLAALPVRLVPGPLAAGVGGGLSPIQISMIIAWCCVLLAALAVGGLLRGAVSLSERRGAFVSAVTHELRTPLTTFRMYTEMMVEGMVTDEEKRASYLRTLQAEAERLDHLVKNVLAYSRLERNRVGGQIEVKSLGDLMERLEDSLVERARQAGMELRVDLTDEMYAVRLRADPSAFERILFNLVDNACKYAVGAEDKRIHLKARTTSRMLALEVCDHGPGVSKRAVRRLFKPFSKSARDAAESAPGVGLGLALSHRLARKMGGELKLDELATDGACFVLTLPTES